MTPILGAQIGAVDDSQGNGTVGDLRSEVDRNMDPVYQDEAILGFQQSINDAWSYAVRGIYRKLHNAIDDMEDHRHRPVWRFLRGLGDGQPGQEGHRVG